MPAALRHRIPAAIIAISVTAVAWGSTLIVSGGAGALTPLTHLFC